MPIRVFVLDDHELVREGLRAVLEREGDIEIVGEAGRMVEGLRRILATRPDVALVDLSLPDGDGLDACRSIKERLPETACLILTSASSDDVLLSAIRADASGFLLKRTAGAELVRSVRLVAAGGTLIDPTLTRRLLERLRTGRVGIWLTGSSRLSLHETPERGVAQRRCSSTLTVAAPAGVEVIVPGFVAGARRVGVG